MFKVCTIITIILLLSDPIYLSMLCDFFGNGNMNEISLLVPEVIAWIVYGVMLIMNIVICIKVVSSKYKLVFKNK